MDKLSFKEQRIRKVTQIYYSKPEIQKAIFEFSKNREVVPRYFEGFGKRPDSLQYSGDVFELVKKGATSFHCSEELWQDPLEIVTGMPENEANDLRIGWDLLVDIDSKYIDYSKISAELIIQALRFHGVKNIGIKFSGSKGFHILVPWRAFPKEVNELKTKDMFPEWPRIIVKYLIEQTKKQLIDKISELSRPSKYIKDFKVSKEVMPDILLVSPRHLFRTPYSLHEKTALASVVLRPRDIKDFELLDAAPLKVKIKEFMPEIKKGEASELLVQALDWYGVKKPILSKKKDLDYQPINISDLSDKNFPPCIQNILKGLSDGRKRSLFVLINFFRSVGMERKELETRIIEWNERNKPMLKEGIIKTQISWNYRRKQMMPQNCKEHYQGIGVCVPDELCERVKNPVNYTIRKSFRGKKKKSKN